MNKIFIIIGLTLFSSIALAEEAKVTPLIQKELGGLENKEGLMLK